MLKQLPILFFVLPLVSFAGTPPDMEAITQCMQSIDDSAFDKFEKEGNELESRVKKLCANGKRDQAQKTAIEFKNKLKDSDEMKQVKKCGDLVRGMMPEMKIPYDNFAEQLKNQHVCDDI